ncbi:MAG: ACP S-malonyltransferase [Treponemataceae bacterium]|nr:ACP S-malonyltransferase [Treponemataceae bacterium]
MNSIVVFPGQGAQFPGMGMDLYESSAAARKVFDDASRIAGIDIPALIKNSSAEELARSDVSQLTITAVSLACYAAMKEQGLEEPGAVAGFSLGEFSALYASGILSFEDTIKLVQARGKIFQAVCDKIAATSENGAAPGMAAVIGLTPEQVCAAIADYSDIKRADAVFAANRNSVKQTVVSGTASGLKAVEPVLSAAGARRFVVLKVAGPFHSPLMAEAAELFAAELDKVTFNEPKLPCFSNVSGKVFENAAQAKEFATRHITEAVRWTDIEDGFAEIIASDNGDSWQILESGPGKVLCGLWKDCPAAASAEAKPMLLGK